MAEKNPLDPLLDQISELLQTFENNLQNRRELKGPPTAEEEADFDILTVSVFAMRQAYVQALKETGLTEEQVKAVSLKNREHLPPKERRTLDRLDQIRHQTIRNANLISHTLKEQRKLQAKTGTPLAPGVTPDDEKRKKRGRNVHVSFRKGWQKM